MPRALKVCSTPSCPNLCTQGKCDDCKKVAEQARGTASQRGYGSKHRTRFRAGVLRKHPVCVLCHQAPSTVADHWPLSRRELVAQGLNPDDPRHGRGLCAPCHNAATQTNPQQRSGWNAR